MATSVESGTFTKSTGAAGSTNVITTSFQPKALLIWGELDTPYYLWDSQMEPMTDVLPQGLNIM